MNQIKFISIFIMLFICLIESCNAQKIQTIIDNGNNTDSNSLTFKNFPKDYYLNKVKTYNTLGYIFLGAGITDLVIMSQSKPWKGDEEYNLGRFFVACLGGVATLTSIPLFIVAHKNKKILSNFNISSKTSYLMQKNNSIAKYTVPTISIIIKF